MNAERPTIAVIGTGLIGSSLALALRKSGSPRAILGLARTPQTLELAVRCGAIDTGLASLRDAAAADIILLCTPVNAILSSLRELGALDVRSSLILDVGSVKVPVLEAAAAAGLGNVFVGGHPMAGSEKTGPAHARHDLFNTRTFFLVPTPLTSPEALACARRLVHALGAVSVEIGPEEHDTTVALTSHLPYLLAGTLSGICARHAPADLPFAPGALAGGFRDLTRIADGSPEMWADILLHNSARVRQWLKELFESASDTLAANADRTQLIKILETMRESRKKLLLRACNGMTRRSR